MKKQTIKVTVRGGLIQDIEGIPDNIIVKVTDYDTDCKNPNITVWETSECLEHLLDS